jgi:hypothetical protein
MDFGKVTVRTRGVVPGMDQDSPTMPRPIAKLDLA